MIRASTFLTPLADVLYNNRTTDGGYFALGKKPIYRFVAHLNAKSAFSMYRFLMLAGRYFRLFLYNYTLILLPC